VNSVAHIRAYLRQKKEIICVYFNPYLPSQLATVKHRRGRNKTSPKVALKRAQETHILTSRSPVRIKEEQSARQQSGAQNDSSSYS
jgi:hypothetical protein